MKRCDHCSEWFEPKYEGVKLCFSCFKKRERALAEYDDLKREIDSLRGQLDRIAWLYGECIAENLVPRETSPIPPDKLRMLIQLAHPDKHGNSPAANDITSWLLSLRKNRAA